MKLDRRKYNFVAVVNCTPHSVTLLDRDNNCRMRFDSSCIARCQEIVEQLHPMDMHDHLPLVAKRFGAVDGLPPSVDNRMYIVSQIVADACPDRCDLLVPSDVVRDGKGQILGCRSFSWRDGN